VGVGPGVYLRKIAIKIQNDSICLLKINTYTAKCKLNIVLLLFNPDFFFVDSLY
jgi:hypothetical protein